MPQVSVPIVAGADDQGVYSNYDVIQSTYPPAAYAVPPGGELPAHRTLQTGPGHYEVHLSLLRFNTGEVLPDNATVTAATLRVYVYGVSDTDSLSLRAEYYPWATAAVSDWTYQNGNNAHTGTLLSALNINVNNTLVLSNLSNISLTGYTGLRLGLSGVGGNFATAPSSTNYVVMRSLEQDATNRAQLIVNYVIEPTEGLGKKKRTQTFAI